MDTTPKQQNADELDTQAAEFVGGAYDGTVLPLDVVQRLGSPLLLVDPALREGAGLRYFILLPHPRREGAPRVYEANEGRRVYEEAGRAFDELTRRAGGRWMTREALDGIAARLRARLEAGMAAVAAGLVPEGVRGADQRQEWRVLSELSDDSPPVSGRGRLHFTATLEVAVDVAVNADPEAI